MQMDTIETSEWNILRTEDKSNWSERPETGEKIIYVGIGITGEKIDATEEEKIEYINMINPDLYIRKVKQHIHILRLMIKENKFSKL